MDLSYPVGRFDFQAPVASETLPILIGEIAAAPALFRGAVEGLSDQQLDTPYRPDGWTVRQVIHHVADSHMNSYIRFHFALTEVDPAMKGYDEKAWADLPDARTGPVDVSLDLIDGLHRRWVGFLRAMTPADFSRGFIHSQLGRVRLDTILALYAWHCRHHAAHITSLRARMGW